MALPLPVVAALVHLLLVAAGLILFLPEGFDRPSGRETRRLLGKYAKFVTAATLVVLVHLLVVQATIALTAPGGAFAFRLPWSFGDRFAEIEAGFTPWVATLWNAPTSLFLSAFYVIVHPWVLYFTIVLYVLTDEERAAKAALLAFPLAYALALPFNLLFPAPHPYLHYGTGTPLFATWPELRDVYYQLTAPTHAFPSLQIAFALLFANAARYTRNRRFRYFTFGYAALVIASVLYLGLHWLLDVAGGIAIALAVGGLTNRVVSVERLARERIKPEPDEAQAIRETAEALVAEARAKLPEAGIEEGEPLLVGSVAKDTYLRSKVDLDVFVLMPPTLPKEELAAKGLAIGRLVLPDGIEKYAEHPYIHGSYRGLPADVVPAYKVADPGARMSAVDRTPFHTRYVLDHMDREQRDEVRLLKQFMTGIGVYGAEAKTRGFSGYLCELIVLKFGSFRGAIRAGGKWKPGTFLALAPIEGNPRFQDPLVFIDPVDERRNAASAVSAETLALYAEACRNYLHRESLAFFFPKELVPQNPDELARLVKRRRGDFLLVSIDRPDVLEDHLYDQLRKAAQGITNLLERHEFEVKKWTTEADHEARILFELARLRLSDDVVHAGPPLKEKDHCARFRKTWQGSPEALSDVYEEEGRLKVRRRREFRRADDLVRAKLLTIDLGKHLTASARERYQILSGPEVVRPETSRVLTKHLTRKKPWEY